MNEFSDIGYDEVFENLDDILYRVWDTYTERIGADFGADAGLELLNEGSESDIRKYKLRTDNMDSLVFWIEKSQTVLTEPGKERKALSLSFIPESDDPPLKYDNILKTFDELTQPDSVNKDPESQTFTYSQN